jgi:Lon protease-like protein
LERIQGAVDALKDFPLPSAVLFPGAVLPLHIFETRYRALVRDCLDSNQVMALSQLEPGWESEYQGRPPMQSICCAGVVAWHAALPDGRFNIILQGVVRARIVAELSPRKPYREVRAQLLPDAPYTGPGDELLRRAVLEVSGRVHGDAGEALLQVASRATGGELADIVASALITDVDRRQQLLSELDVRSRMEAVLSDVSELIARMGPTGPPGTLN